MPQKNSNIPVILNGIADVFENRNVQKSDVVYVFAQIRKILEQTKQAPYPTLRFYCNWSAHHRLRDSAIIYRLLEEITEKLLHIDRDANFHDHFPLILKFELLRDEFSSFCKEYDLNPYWASVQSNWNEVFTKLLSHLIEVPIEFPSLSEMNAGQKDYGKALSAYNRIMTKTGGNACGVTGFRLAEVTDERGSFIYWELKTNQDWYNVQGALTNIFLKS